MRGATDCARRLRKLLKSIKGTSRPQHPGPDDPVTQLILGVFTRDMPESRAKDVLDRLRSSVVDYNELRVTSPRELAEHVGDIPDAFTKCEDLTRALNRVFGMQHTVTLEHLRERSRKDARDYLTKLDGLDAYSRARVILLGLGQHAVPLDEAMWAYARKLQIVDQKATLEEAQSFLERHISEEDAVDFFVAFRKLAWAECGAAVRAGNVEKIRSIPPKRASRNMLRPILPSGEFDPEPLPAASDGETKPPPRKPAPQHRANGAVSGSKADRTRTRPPGKKKAKSA